jgi:hypothetical protein
MSLLKLKPRKRIRITKAAKMIGCSSESIRTGAVGPFKIFKLNPEKATSPFLMYEADLNEYLERKEFQ